MAEYIEFLRLCESPEADNPQFIAWVTMLPSILEQISIEFAPNLLQFKYLADYALAGDTLYVISGVFKNSVVIHEYLHLALKPIRGTLLNIVQSHPLSWYVNMEKCWNWDIYVEIVLKI